MDAIRRTSTLRRVATTASLAALLLAPGTAEAKKKAKPKPPVITSVQPLSATVGDTLTIKGKNFRKGKGRNTVGFKRTGEAIVFVKAGLSTKRVMAVKLSSKLEKVLGDGQAARFNLRVLTSVFGKQYTSKRLSPMIAPRPPKLDPSATPVPGTTPPTPPAPVCDAGTSETADRDSDLLSDGLEQRIGTSGCKADSDEDGVTDGYEYRSAIDLNDDEYQTPNQSLPYPAKLPYPNPLSPADAKDDKVDHDGDGLSLRQEFDLWTTTTPEGVRTLADQGSAAATPLNYSAGLQFSKSRRCVDGDSAPLCGPGHAGRRVPSLPAADYDKWADFNAWAAASGYATVALHDQEHWFEHGAGRFDYSILDTNRVGGVDAGEEFPLDEDDNSWLSDDERDEDADGLSNIVESRVEMRPEYWAGCYEEEVVYPVTFAGTDLVNADTDADGVRDGADDSDHDDVPNMMELSRYAASGYLDTDNFVKGSVSTVGSGPLCQPDPDLLEPVDVPETPEDESAQGYPRNHPDAYGQVHPFNPCLPDSGSRSCARFYEGEFPAPFTGPHWWSLQ